MHFPTTAAFLSLLAVPSVLAQAPSINDANFRNTVLNTHNADRAKHGVGGLKWDNKLAQFAQNAANDCAFKHTGGPYGENLYGSWSTNKPDYLKLTKAGIHDSWYNEVRNYNYNKPGFSMATGHFTQVVWKATTKVGCAWNTRSCKSNGMNFYKFVCEYEAPGNFKDRFKENVPRPVKKRELGQLAQEGQEIVDEPIEHFEEFVEAEVVEGELVQESLDEAA